MKLLAGNGIPLSTISLIGRSFETLKGIQGFYRPAETKLSRSKNDAWSEGIFATMVSDLGLFVFPDLGSVTVLGPLSGALSTNINEHGSDGLLKTLSGLGITPDQAKQYESLIHSGRFIVLVHGFDIEISLATEILQATAHMDLKINR